MSNIIEFHDKTKTMSVNADKEKDTITTYYTFIPKVWDKIVPEDNNDKSDKYLVFFYLNFNEYEKHKISLSIRVGDFPDAEERVRFVTQLSEAVKKSADSGLTVNSSSKKYMTIFKETIFLKYGKDEDCDLDDYETVTGKLIEAYNSPEVVKAFKVVDDVVRKFWVKKVLK